ncbi:MAG: flavodoxin [Actinomycetota bacterium]|nr:flavodoxin [Actinomycetota bacterium]
MPRLLVVHHTVSPSLHTLATAVLEAAAAAGLDGVEVVGRPALVAGPVDALGADGYVLVTPANIGYMSGALKHFFDQCYYPCLEQTAGRPYGCVVHGNDDTTGAVRSIEMVAGALGWRRVHLPVTVAGEPSRGDLEAAGELAATVAAVLDADL